MKKKVLFLYSRDIEINDAGGSRTTIMLIKYLIANGFECHCLFKIINGPMDSVVYYKQEQNLYQQIRQIIQSNDIHVIIIPEGIIYADNVKKCIEGLDCKIISALHNKPGYERCRLYVQLIESLLFNKSVLKRLRALLMLTVYPLFYFLYINKVAKSFRKLYYSSDFLVLLSKRFIPDFIRLYKVPNDKIVAIGNPASFGIYASNDDVLTKSKTVLIVARFDERSKRLLLALKIWKKVSLLYPDWNLDIVGFGRALPVYESYIKRFNIRGVSFLGKQAPLEYYRKASIFMMTSAFEGWGMTIVEAMQLGCVPIVMNSFGSLCDIVDSGKNGIIVDNNDVDGFVKALRDLIENRTKREIMADNAIEKSKKWTKENTCGKYQKLIEQCLMK
jgi:glycosyltransferase involved in cell wall biosynthesis